MDMDVSATPPGNTGGVRWKRATSVAKDTINAPHLKRAQETSTPASSARPLRRGRAADMDSEDLDDKENTQDQGCGVTPSRLKCFKELRDELTCAVCLDVCVRPCTTPCGHNYCRSCLRRNLELNAPCPKCRASVPPGYELNINTTLWNTIQHLFPAEAAAKPPTPQSVVEASRQQKRGGGGSSNAYGNPAAAPFRPPRPAYGAQGFSGSSSSRANMVAMRMGSIGLASLSGRSVSGPRPDRHVPTVAAGAASGRTSSLRPQDDADAGPRLATVPSLAELGTRSGAAGAGSRRAPGMAEAAGIVAAVAQRQQQQQQMLRRRSRSAERWDVEPSALLLEDGDSARRREAAARRLPNDTGAGGELESGSGQRAGQPRGTGASRSTDGRMELTAGPQAPQLLGMLAGRPGAAAPASRANVAGLLPVRGSGNNAGALASGSGSAVGAQAAPSLNPFRRALRPIHTRPAGQAQEAQAGPEGAVPGGQQGMPPRHPAVLTAAQRCMLMSSNAGPAASQRGSSGAPSQPGSGSGGCLPALDDASALELSSTQPSTQRAATHQPTPSAHDTDERMETAPNAAAAGDRLGSCSPSSSPDAAVPPLPGSLALPNLRRIRVGPAPPRQQPQQVTAPQPPQAPAGSTHFALSAFASVQVNMQLGAQLQQHIHWPPPTHGSHGMGAGRAGVPDSSEDMEEDAPLTLDGSMGDAEDGEELSPPRSSATAQRDTGANTSPTWDELDAEMARCMAPLAISPVTPGQLRLPALRIGAPRAAAPAARTQIAAAGARETPDHDALDPDRPDNYDGCESAADTDCFFNSPFYDGSMVTDAMRQLREGEEWDEEAADRHGLGLGMVGEGAGVGAAGEGGEEGLGMELSLRPRLLHLDSVSALEGEEDGDAEMPGETLGGDEDDDVVLVEERSGAGGTSAGASGAGVAASSGPGGVRAGAQRSTAAAAVVGGSVAGGGAARGSVAGGAAAAGGPVADATASPGVREQPIELLSSSSDEEGPSSGGRALAARLRTGAVGAAARVGRVVAGLRRPRR